MQIRTFLVPTCIALIPARGGSKSIPRKNLVEICGKPLIAWTIELALKLECVDRVIVSTDDPEIKQVSLRHGAEVPFIRPDTISQDLSTDVEYHLHAVEWLQANDTYTPDIIMNLRPTMPAREVAPIEDAFNVFMSAKHADSLRSIEIAEQSPYKMWLLEESGLIAPVVTSTTITEPYNQPRQSLPVAYRQNGYVDLVRTESLKRLRSTTGSKIIPFIIDRPPLDIDYLMDLGRAEDELQSMINERTLLPPRAPYPV